MFILLGTVGFCLRRILFRFSIVCGSYYSYFYFWEEEVSFEDLNILFKIMGFYGVFKFRYIFLFLFLKWSVYNVC